jgi:hypothetical protein
MIDQKERKIGKIKIEKEIGKRTVRIGTGVSLAVDQETGEGDRGQEMIGIKEGPGAVQGVETEDEEEEAGDGGQQRQYQNCTS